MAMAAGSGNSAVSDVKQKSTFCNEASKGIKTMQTIKIRAKASSGWSRVW